MWDIAGGGMEMLRGFGTAARELVPKVQGERLRAGVSQGDIADRFRCAGLEDVVEGTLETQVTYSDFDDYWEPFTYAVGPAGNHLQSLVAERQDELRELVKRHLPDGQFTLTGRAWYARGTRV
jgi:hypothetical protein